MEPRTYTMRARAASTLESRERIVRAMLDLSAQRLTVDITLNDVAALAGVSVRTVLRHFGDRERLLDAAVEAGVAEVRAERSAPPGDPEAAIRALVDHYERIGDLMVRLIAQEDDPRIGPIVDLGRGMHRDWVRTVFDLPPEPDIDGSILDLLVVATDLYTWKLLRRDRGLDRREVADAMRRLVSAVLADRAHAATAEGDR